MCVWVCVVCIQMWTSVLLGAHKVATTALTSPAAPILWAPSHARVRLVSHRRSNGVKVS